MGGPRREIERACDRDERRAGLSVIVRVTKRTGIRRGASESERPRETNDESVRMLRLRERVRKSGPVVGRVTNDTRTWLG